MDDVMYNKKMRKFKKFIKDINPSVCEHIALLPKEYDNRIRDSEIWLYCRAIQGSNSNSSNRQQGSPSSFLFSHWMLVFEFIDKTVAVIEGLNVGDKLIPNYSKFIEDHWRRYKMIGKKRTSPARVRKLALMNPFNNSLYSLLTLNCQHWANKAIELLEEC